MGGITGCLALADGTGPDTEWVSRAGLRVAHRGPDDEGSYADPDLAMAFRRLAVIDPSAGGRQPVYSADGRYVLAFDGEIYNYVELAPRLAGRGIQLRTRSGAEVLVEMYAWLGKDVVRQLRGMYAFAIWDRRTRELPGAGPARRSCRSRRRRPARTGRPRTASAGARPPRCR